MENSFFLKNYNDLEKYSEEIRSSEYFSKLKSSKSSKAKESSSKKSSSKDSSKSPSKSSSKDSSKFSSKDSSSKSFKSSTKDFKTPRIIHQTWKNEKLPEKLENWRNMWKKMCPDYEHKFYTDEDLYQVIEKHFPQYCKAFKAFGRNIERVDFWRYAALYVYGGVYADLDVYPLKNIEEWLEKGKVVLGREPIEHAKYYNGSEFLLCNAFMISPKGDPFWLDLMEYIVKNYNNGDPVATTGPGILTQMYREYPEKYKNVIITEPNCFYPLTFNKSRKIEEYKGEVYKNVSATCSMKEAYVVHMWEGSWTTGFPNWGIILIFYGTIAFIFLLFLFLILFLIRC